MADQSQPGVQLEVDCFARTDVGGRSNNEDAFLVCDLGSGDTSLPYRTRRRLSTPGLLVLVSDGMGGAEGGEIASTLAADAIKGHLLARRAELAEAAPTQGERRPQEAMMEQAFIEAGEVLRRTAEQRALTGMGATATALLLVGESCYLAHVGDSRAYRVAGGKIEQLSEDHSLVAELERMGQLTAQQARVHPRRSVLTQSLGAVPTLKVQTRTIPLADGDLLLLCSDGLSSVLSDTKLLHAALESGGAREICHQLVAMAKGEKADDNVTVAVCAVHRSAASVTSQTGASALASGRTTASHPRRHLISALTWAVGLSLGLLWAGHPRSSRFPFVLRLAGKDAVIVQERPRWFGRWSEQTVKDSRVLASTIVPTALPALRQGIAFRTRELAVDYLKQARGAGPQKGGEQKAAETDAHGAVGTGALGKAKPGRPEQRRTGQPSRTSSGGGSRRPKASEAGTTRRRS